MSSQEQQEKDNEEISESEEEEDIERDRPILLFKAPLSYHLSSR